jgi:hypothetical protein
MPRPISRLPPRTPQHPSVAELVKRHQEFLPPAGVGLGGDRVCMSSREMSLRFLLCLYAHPLTLVTELDTVTTRFQRRHYFQFRGLCCQRSPSSTETSQQPNTQPSPFRPQSSSPRSSLNKRSVATHMIPSSAWSPQHTAGADQDFTRRHMFFDGGRKPRPVASAFVNVAILDSIRHTDKDGDSELSFESGEADDEGDGNAEAREQSRGCFLSTAS